MYRKTESQLHNSDENTDLMQSQFKGVSNVYEWKCKNGKKPETKSLQNQMLLKSNHSYYYIYEKHRLRFLHVFLNLFLNFSQIS